jgi:hypothetical protein
MPGTRIRCCDQAATDESATNSRGDATSRQVIEIGGQWYNGGPLASSNDLLYEKSPASGAFHEG